MSKLHSLFYFISCTVLAGHVAADIVADGGTATSVGVATNGVETVQIAPADSSRVSHNTYSAFNVSSDGAALDNRIVAARTIVNEVTSNSVSSIQGDVEVLGTRAHVILANPNGITVDGGRFINVGNLALSTGDITFNQQQIAPGIFQNNAVSTVSGGQIVIGPDGLSGSMTGLHLLAERIKVDGPVTNTTDDSRASISMVAGASETEFDSSLAANNLNRAWTSTQAIVNPNDAVLVDIGSGGLLEASAIQMVVTADGAGVRHAGRMVASRNSFTLSSTGLVDVQGGEVTAAGDVLLTAHTLSMTETDRQAALQAANGELVLDISASITNQGGLLQGNTAVDIQAGGDISNLSTPENLAIVFATAGDLEMTSLGTITNDGGRIIGNADVDIDAAVAFNNVITAPSFAGRGEIEVTQGQGRRLWYFLFQRHESIETLAVDYGELTVPHRIALLVANGAINITAPTVNNIGGDINANAGSVSIAANHTVSEGVLSGSAYYEQRCGFGCSRSGSSTIQVNGGNINASDSIYIAPLVPADTSSFVLTNGNLLAVQGDISVEADDISASSALIFDVITRPAGVYGLYLRDDAKVARRNQGGSFLANMGIIDLTALRPVTVSGGVVLGDTVNVPSTLNITPPINENPIFGHHIGIFWRWLD